MSEELSRRAEASMSLSEVSDLPIFHRPPNLRLSRPPDISEHTWDVMTDDQRELILFRRAWGMDGCKGQIVFYMSGSKFLIERPMEYSESHLFVSVSPIEEDA